MTPKSESFWLALLMGGIVLAIIGLLVTALLVLPWRSNFMVFQLPEKKAVPVIQMPEGAQSAPMPHIVPAPGFLPDVPGFPPGRNPITPTPVHPNFQPKASAWIETRPL